MIKTPESLFLDKLAGEAGVVVDFASPIRSLLDLRNKHKQHIDTLGSKFVSKEMKETLLQFDVQLAKHKQDLVHMLLSHKELHPASKTDLIAMTLEDIFENYDFELYVKKKV